MAGCDILHLLFYANLILMVLLYIAASETVANAFRVRVAGKPSKKKEHPGIFNEIPAVSGNKKTKDPVCKGFAFVDLKTEDDANM